MKLQQQANLRLKGLTGGGGLITSSITNSAQKPKLKMAAHSTQSQQQTISSAIKGGRDAQSSIGRAGNYSSIGVGGGNNNLNGKGGRQMNNNNSNYQTTISHERRVSFDTKQSNYNTNNQYGNGSTAAATLAAASKYGNQIGNGMTGINRSKSPIDAQVSASNAYQSLLNDENIYDNIPIKLNSLAEEYKQRQLKMDHRLKQEIENHSIAQVSGKTPNVRKLNVKEIKKKKSTSPLHTNENFVNTSSVGALDSNNQILGSVNSAASMPHSKFFRSQRSVAMRIKDTYESELNQLESNKLQLIQKLNDSLLELDRMNQEKSSLSQLLIEQIKFVRDMQRETQKGDDISGVVNDDLVAELRQEKELSLQLKEDLKNSEQERLRILQRLHELSQLHQDGEIRHSDINIDLTVKSRTYEDLQAELRQNAEDIARNQNHIDNLRAQILANQESIRLLRDSVDKTVDDKREMHHQITQLQDKYDESFRNYQKERIDTDQMQSRHIKLISSNILFDNLVQIYKNKLQMYLNYLRFVAQSKFQLSRGLKSIRNLFKQNRSRRLKRFLYLWFTNALHPMKTKQQKERIAVQMREKSPAIFAFYRWRNAFEKSQSQMHKKRQIILQMLISKNDYHLRAQKYLFIHWRDVIRINTEDRKKIIKKCLIKRERVDMAKYFSRWAETSLELDNQIHLNALAQRVAFKKYKSVLFAGWREISRDRKERRIATQCRVWKNMKIYTLTRKQMRGQTWSILREQRVNTQNLLKCCFDSWRVQKEEQKYKKVIYQLNQVELQRQSQAKQIIAQVSQVDEERLKVQATKALSKCFGKLLFQYFRQWQQFTEAKRDMIQVNMKQRVLTVYYKHLRYAFTRWIDYKGHVMIQYQSDVISQEQTNIQDLQTQIAQTHQELEEKKQKQQCLSSKQIRKILNTAYEKRLKEHFSLWKANMDRKIYVQDNLEKVLMKLNRRQKRQAFDRYLSKIKDFKLEMQFQKKVSVMRLKLQEKTKREIYEAICQFSQEYIRAKNSMRRLLARLDVSLKENTFRKWQKYENNKTVKQLEKQQNVKVENLALLQNEIQEKADVLENLNQANKKLDKVLTNNARRVIRLAFQRCIQGSQGQAFAKWVDYVSEERMRNRVMFSKYLHLFRGTIANAFRIWSLNIRQQMQIMYEEGIQSEEKQIQKIQTEAKQNNKIFSKDADQAGSQLDKLRESQQKLMQKHQNCLKALINRKDNQDFVSKQRYILYTWRNYVQKRQNFFQIMDKFINRELQHQGLLAIKQTAQENNKANQVQDKSKILFWKYSKIKLRFAFAQWREGSKIICVETRENLDKEIKSLIKQQDKIKNFVQNRIQDQLLENRKHLRTADVFMAWSNYSNNLKILKIKINTYQQQQQQRDQQRSINKWLCRIRKTQNFNHIKTKIDRVYNQSLVRSVYNAWQDFNYFNRELSISLQSMVCIVDKVFTKQMFSKIKLQADLTSFKNQRAKARGVELLASKLSSIFIQRKLQLFNQLRIENLKEKRQLKGFKSIIKYQITRKIRDYFNIWREESERKSVIKLMNEEGPVAIQNHNLKKMIYNLKLKALQDGYNSQEVQQIIIDNRRSSIRGIERSVCRLLSYNEDLYLLPKCLDRWKKWVQYRKMFKYWLNYLNNKADVKKSPLFWAFQRWRHIDLEQYQQLNKQPKDNLTQIFVQNDNKMHELVRNLELADAATDELTDQRDNFLKRYVSAQRLGLSAINSQNQFSKQKVLSKWLSQNQRETQVNYEDALKQNLQRIQAFKDKIKYLETSNNELADQNEDLRQGALDGIEMAKQIDDLHRDREKLSVDLADKAITIRKLLEDNNNLSIRLSNAQEEAQNLIKMSQLKLDKSQYRGSNYAHYDNDDY